MVTGVGIDLVEIDRIDRLIKKWKQRFTRKLFTAHEIETCSRRANQAGCFAARFAAKEALAKALGHGLCRHFRWRDVEVRSRSNGQPEFDIQGVTGELVRSSRVSLSLTHTATCAGAVVVIENTACKKADLL